MLQALRRFTAAPSAPFLRQKGARFFSGEIPKEAWNQHPTIVSTLPNGVRVATQKTYDETATVGVWIDSGSRYETKETNGVAHFLEHMTFKGTKKRSRVQLEKEIEDIGAHLNAYTAREQTVYYVKAFKEDVKQGLDILSDILLNSNIDQKDVDAEKGVILREMEEVEKSTEEVSFDRLHQTAFRDCSLGYTILGPVENIQKMKREHLTDYIKKNYTPERMVIAAAGNVDHKAIVAAAEATFGKVAPYKGALRPQEGKPYFCGSEFVFRNDDMGPTAYMAVAFEGVPWKSPDAVPFMLMQAIIGSYNKYNSFVPGIWSGNKVIHTMAHRGDGFGACDSYSAFNTCYKDTGLWGYYASCDELAVDNCFADILFGCVSLAYSITDEEVNRGRLALKTQLFGSLDNTTAVAEEIGRHMLVYGRRVPMAEFIKRLDIVDAEEIKRIAWKYIHDAEIAVTAMGPVHGLQPYYNLRRQTFWNRY